MATPPPKKSGKKRTREPSAPLPTPPPPPTYDAHFWKSEEHEKRYTDKTSKRPFVRERKFVLDRDEYPEFQAQLRTREWVKFGEMLTDSSPTIAREFFANAFKGDQGSKRTFTSWVRGKLVKYDANHIQKLLKIRRCDFSGDTCAFRKNWQRIEIPPRRSDPAFESWTKMGAAEPILQTIAKPNMDWVKTKDGVEPKLILIRKLNGEARVWFHFVISNVMPSSNQNEVILKKAVLLHTIMKKERVELPLLLRDSIYDMAHSDSDSASLGHCSLIQLLCKQAGVDVTDNGAPTKLHPTIDAALIRKQLRIGGGEVTGLAPGRKSTAEADDEDLEERLRTGEQWMVDTDFRMRHLRRRLRFMQTSQHSFQTYMVKVMTSICEAQGLDVIPFQPAVYPHSDEEEEFEAAARTHYADHVDGAAPADGATSSHAAQTPERQPAADATAPEMTATADSPIPADPLSSAGVMDEDRAVDASAYNPVPPSSKFMHSDDDEESTD